MTLICAVLAAGSACGQFGGWGAIATRTTGIAVLEIGVGDFDNDGLDDIIWPSPDNGMFIRWGTPDPVLGSTDAFVPFPPRESGNGMGLAFTSPEFVPGFLIADYNDDGIDDAAWIGWGYNTAQQITRLRTFIVFGGARASLMSTTVDGHTIPQTLAPRSGTAADMDGDGDTDIIYSSTITTSSPELLFFQENLGSGQFAAATQITVTLPQGAVFAQLAADDLDGDGRAEIVAVSRPSSSGFTSPRIWSDPDQDGIWDDTGSIGPSTVWDTRIADFTNDGQIDIALVGPSEIRLLENDGNLNFTTTVSTYDLSGLSVEKYRTVSKDVDGDGNMDLLRMIQNNNGVTRIRS